MTAKPKKQEQQQTGEINLSPASMKCDGIYKTRTGSQQQKTIALPDRCAAYYSRYVDRDGRIILIPVRT